MTKNIVRKFLIFNPDNIVRIKIVPIDYLNLKLILHIPGTHPVIAHLSNQTLLTITSFTYCKTFFNRSTKSLADLQ